MKRCTKCGENKKEASFYVKRRPNGKVNLQGCCKSCFHLWEKRWKCLPENRKKLRETWRRGLLRKRYNITPEEFKFLQEKQKNCCAICTRKCRSGKQANSIVIDHDHKTGKLRALLCSQCNKGLGCFNDDINLLKKVISYLRKFSNE